MPECVGVPDSSGTHGNEGDFMDPSTIIIWLIIGAVAGWLTGLIFKGRGFGLIGDIVVGIIGAVIGGWLVRA